MDQIVAKDNPDRRIAEQAMIKARLLKAGLPLAEIDRRFGLPSGTARNTLREPNPRGERAIASALGARPHLLWKSRYRPNGLRRSPQDWSRPPTMAQRRQEARA